MCGAVRFRADNVPSDFGACYCDSCRRWSGDRFVGVHVDTQALQIFGGADVNSVRSSDWAERAFCRHCGSGLWFRITAGPQAGTTSISVGLIDDVSGMTLAREFYVDRKTCLHELPDGRVQLTTTQVEAQFAPEGESAP